MPGVEEIYPKHASPQPSLSDLVAHNFVQTNSVLYRWRYHGEEPFRLDEGSPGGLVRPPDACRGRAHRLPAPGHGGLPQARGRDVGRPTPPSSPGTRSSAIPRSRSSDAPRPFRRALRRRLRGLAEGDPPAPGRGLSRREDVPSLGRADRRQSRHRPGGPARYGLDAPEDLSGEPAALRAWLEEQLTVSVIVTAYNHAGYIRRCLDGVLSQRGLFKLQVVIGDDRSTDGRPRSSNPTGRAIRSGSPSAPGAQPRHAAQHAGLHRRLHGPLHRVLRGRRLLAVRPQDRDADAHAAQRPRPRHVLQLGAAALPGDRLLRAARRAGPLPHRHDQLPGAGQCAAHRQFLLLLLPRRGPAPGAGGVLRERGGGRLADEPLRR